jgi:hypothetical protein
LFLRDQGGRIGRISSHWVIVYFGQLFENCLISPNFWASLFYGQSNVLFWAKKIGWTKFLAISEQTDLVTLSEIFIQLSNASKQSACPSCKQKINLSFQTSKA